MQAQVGGMNVVEAEAGAEENERKLVKTGSISFEVENLDTTYDNHGRPLYGSPRVP